MKRRSAWVAAGAAAVAALLCAPASAAVTPSGHVNVTWHTVSILKIVLTPNYYAGFGAIPATFGTPPSPTHGPDAVLDGGTVDFGNIYSGATYLYKYAAHLNVMTNSSTGYYLYGEGATDFTNQSDGTSTTLSQTLYYLPSTDGTVADSNNGYSASLPFSSTSSALIASSSAENGNYYYDYQLRMPAAATPGKYYVWINYTVVPR